MIEIFNCIFEMCKCLYLCFDIVNFRVNNNKVNNNKDYQSVKD
jgi:hypothetical protein